MSKVIRNSTSGAIKLTPNFFLSELTVSDYADRNGIDNSPPAIIVPNLFKVASMLEKVRAALGNKVISVSSGYRSPALNAAIGGSATSEHSVGMAADFNCRSFGTPLQVCHAIVKAGIPFGQLIYEGGWVHMSAPDGKNDGQLLTAVFTPGKPTTYVKGLPQ